MTESLSVGGLRTCGHLVVPIAGPADSTHCLSFGQSLLAVAESRTQDFPVTVQQVNRT